MRNLNLRIKKYPRGYVVEIERESGWLFKSKRWEHLIGYAGLEDMAYFYRTEEDATGDLVYYIKRNLIDNSEL